MKKRILIVLAVLLNSFAIGQNSQSKKLNYIPQEYIFLHHNSTFFLTGEYIYYKIYCMNSLTSKLSKFSKVAYVELVDSDYNSIFKHKIILKNGIGQGDYFIPSSIRSGSYKIIAYTQWMRNDSIQYFYQNDIGIINPYQSDQSAVLLTNLNKESNFDNQKNRDNQKNIAFKNDNKIELSSESDSYKSRKEVTLHFNVPTNAMFGNYSISVRKMEDLPVFDKSTALQIRNLNEQKSKKIIDVNIPNLIIPELRGELLTGRINWKNSNKPAENVKVALSIPGENFIYKISNSNSKGIYNFILDKEYENKKAVIQVVDKDNDNYDFNLINSEPIDYSSLNFRQFKITSANKNLILDHSINNQIENAYSSVKSDHFVDIKKIDPFFKKSSNEYILDEYTRFPTIKETIVEIIEEVSLRRKNNEYSFHVRVYDDKVETGLQSLLLIDGLYIHNHNEIVNSKASRIKKISVVNEQYIYGSQIFSGIIFMETFDGNYYKTFTNQNGKEIELFSPLHKKEYFNQVYDNSGKFERIPDFRAQLVWEPNFIIESMNKNYSFYTSDLKGDFEICLEGYSKEGIPVSIRKIIKVN